MPIALAALGGLPHAQMPSIVLAMLAHLMGVLFTARHTLYVLAGDILPGFHVLSICGIGVGLLEALEIGGGGDMELCVKGELLLGLWLLRSGSSV